MTHLFTDPDALRFLKYLNLINATKGKSYAANLNDAEIRVLNTLALGWHVGEPITVTDAILVNTQCCSSSTHRILKKLRQKEYVEFLVSEIDNRVKYLLPTAATVAYFALMGRCLMES